MNSKLHFFQGLTRIVTDGVSVILAWLLAYWIRPWTDLIPFVQLHTDFISLPELSFFYEFIAWTTLGMIIIFSSLSLYSYPAKYISFKISGRISWGLVLWALGIIAVYALVFKELIFSRMMLVHALIFAFIFMLIGRSILLVIWKKLFRETYKTLVIGNKSDIEYFHQVFEKSIFDIIDSPLSDTNTNTDLKNISDIFFFEQSEYQKQLQYIREQSAEKGILLHVIPSYAEEFWGHAHFEVKRGLPMITSTPLKQTPWWFAMKRGMDIVLSLLFLILLSPVFLLLALWIKFDSNGPVFYVSKRVGRNGKLFDIIKFRSMVSNAEDLKKELEEQSHREGPLFKIKDDPRITPVGKFLRKTSLDEIPQFWNVLKGDMSIIGPRPHLESEVIQYTASQRRVLSAKPGISGLAQVSGRSDLSFQREMFLDAYYCEHQDLFMDIMIFIKTPFVLLFGRGAD